MAWNLEASTTFSLAGGSGAQDVTLPGTPAQGDVVVVACGADLQGPVINTSGYTDIFANTTNDPPGAVAVKEMGATPDTVVNITAGTFADRDTNGVIQIWSGARSGDILAGTPPTAATGTTGTPNPPSMTVDEDGALVFAVGGQDDQDDAAGVSAPSGYSNLIAQDTQIGAAGYTQMMASLQRDSGSEDPGAFTGIASDAWWAVTFALAPGDASYEQEGYQFRLDDGSESGATDIGSQDTNITAPPNQNRRLRVLTDTTGDAPSEGVTFQYRRVGDPDSEWEDLA